MVTKFDEVLLGYQPCQVYDSLRRFNQISFSLL